MRILLRLVLLPSLPLKLCSEFRVPSMYIECTSNALEFEPNPFLLFHLDEAGICVRAVVEVAMPS
jgi:hypothetical protein